MSDHSTGGREQRVYASETNFLKSRHLMAKLADSTNALSTSEAHMPLTELCELCLDSDMALAMLENGFLDECVLLFRGNPIYTVQLIVTTLICICLHCRVGRVYYSRNLTHTSKFLVEMLKNTRSVPEKLNRYYESSNTAKPNVLPLAFTAFAWPHLIIPESPSTPDVPKEYEAMGRQIFESAKSYIAENRVLPPLPSFAECEVVNGSIKTSGSIIDDFTVSNLAVHCLFMLLDAGETARSVFKRQAPFLHKLNAVQSVLERNPMNHRLYLIELLNLQRLVQDTDALSAFENTLWNSFQQYTINPERWALQGKYALQALIILESNSKWSVLKSKRHKSLLQKYLLELDESSIDVQDPCVAMAWGLALLLGENFISKSFLGLLITKMIKGFQKNQPHNPHHAYICWVVGAFFLQGYLEIPVLVLRRMIDSIEKLGVAGSAKLHMMASELEKNLPEQRQLKLGQKRACDGINPPAKHVKRAPKFARVVGPSSSFFWGLTSQLYLSRVHSVCEDAVSPWKIAAEQTVTEEQLYPDLSSPIEKPEPEVELSPRVALSPPPLQAIHDNTLGVPTTPQYSSEATVDWTPQSVRGFGESRHPISIPPPLHLSSGRSVPKVDEENPDLSNAMPTFTAMFELQGGIGSPVCRDMVSGPGKLLLPAAEISHTVPPDSAVLFSLTPTKYPTFNPSLEGDARAESSSAFLEVPFTPVSAALGSAMH